MEFMGERRSRTIAILAALVIGFLTPQPQVLAAEFDPAGIVFPVIGEVHFTDTFDAARSGGRTHGATDIMGDKMLPVVAAADGVVRWIGSSCCYLSIDHGGGWETWYIHLNNDTAGTDDGLGWGIADGVSPGAMVSQGQLIGWVGDSGNAESVGSHLHFEIRKDDVPVNPYPYLLNAPRLGGSAPPPAAHSGVFTDDDVSVHEADIEKLHATGITAGCSTDPMMYCPEQNITRGEMAVFLFRAFGLAPTEADFFPDDAGHFAEPAINAATAAGIGFGCTVSEFCPDRALLREEMAELLARAMELPTASAAYFVDDDASPFETAINSLREAGVTVGCSLEPALYCPEDPVTRAQMATFFARALGL